MRLFKYRGTVERWIAFEKRTSHRLEADSVLTFGCFGRSYKLVDDRTVEVTPLTTILWYPSPFPGIETPKRLERFGKEHCISHVRKIKTRTELNNRPDDSALASPTSGPFWSVLPKIDAMTEPIVRVCTGLPASDL